MRWYAIALVAVLTIFTTIVAWPGKSPSPPPVAAPVEPAAPSGPAWFRDVTTEVGLQFNHDPGPLDDRYFMPQIVGSGAALFDCDGDGRLDVYLLNNGGPRGKRNAFFRQSADGKFRDASENSGLDFAGYGMGVAVGDANNDGRPDVLVTEFGGLRLLRNVGDGRFEACERSGVESSLWGTSACWLDYDRDGWLDLAVANYVAYDPAWPCTNADGLRDYCHPKVFPGTVAKLFHNVTGEAGGELRFEDVTVASGVARFPGPGLGVASADFDGDGWPDILVANDAHPNFLWINQRNGTFKEEAVSRGVACDAVGRSLANMGIAIADTRGTGRFDVFITHLPEETNTLWRQEPRGVFIDDSAASGVLTANWRATGFGAAFADFNHDGLLDLAIVNGRVVRSRTASGGDHWSAYAERNQLFSGREPGRFRDVSVDNADLCGSANVARALAIGDVDGDGGLDLLLTCAGGAARLLKNIAPDRGHWLLVKAEDPRLNRDAYGAEVTVIGASRRWVGWVNPGQSFLSSHDPRVHFGLEKTATIEAVEVLWPDGLRERFAVGNVDRVLEVRRGEGTSTIAP